MWASLTLVFFCSVTVVFAGSLFHNRIGGQMWQYSFQEGGVGATRVQDDVGSELSMGALVMNTAAAEYLPTSTGVRTLGSGGLAFKSERSANALYSFLEAATQPNPATSDNTNFAVEWWMQGPVTISSVSQVVFGWGNWGPSNVPKCVTYLTSQRACLNLLYCVMEAAISYRQDLGQEEQPPRLSSATRE
jgi:hypothetical protein